MLFDDYDTFCKALRTEPGALKVVNEPREWKSRGEQRVEGLKNRVNPRWNRARTALRRKTNLTCLLFLFPPKPHWGGRGKAALSCRALPGLPLPRGAAGATRGRRGARGRGMAGRSGAPALCEPHWMGDVRARGAARISRAFPWTTKERPDLGRLSSRGRLLRMQGNQSFSRTASVFWDVGSL